MRRVELQSTTLKAVIYRSPGAWLELEFRSGAIYRYLHVPTEIYEGLLAAQSKGRYFNEHIRDHFPTLKIYPPGDKTITLPQRQGEDS